MNHRKEEYITSFIKRKNNGEIKLITSSKIDELYENYAFNIYKEYLIENGVDENHIIEIDFAVVDSIEYSDIKELLVDSEMYYLFLDNIQYIKDYEELLEKLNSIFNVDIYAKHSLYYSENINCDLNVIDEESCNGFYQNLEKLIEIHKNCYNADGKKIFCFELIKNIIDEKINKDDISDERRIKAKEQIIETKNWFYSMGVEFDYFEELINIVN